MDEGLFDEGRIRRPLAERMRPRSLGEISGLDDLVGEGGWLRRLVQKGRVPSMILHGPPGTGKTTLARLLAQESGAVFVQANAVATGVAELRKIFEAASALLRVEGRRTILFVDEIHRLNKAQQDVLLPYVEDGTVVFVGATTENPFFDVIGPLLSRARTVAFHPLSDEAMAEILGRALGDRERGLGEMGVRLSDDGLASILGLAQGDARVALGLLEEASELRADRRTITAEDVHRIQGEKGRYDRAGDEHYETISAFIKSVRGSDPDAAMLWLTKMLEMGEEVRFIARRLVILASEDVGLADPRALQVAVAAAQATELLGLPECAYALAEATLYLALAPKSNSAAEALEAGREIVRREGRLPVPPRLRNLAGRAKAEAKAEDYLYPHDYPGHWVAEDYWPTGVSRSQVYRGSDEGEEGILRRRKPGPE